MQRASFPTQWRTHDFTSSAIKIHGLIFWAVIYCSASYIKALNTAGAINKCGNVKKQKEWSETWLHIEQGVCCLLYMYFKSGAALLILQTRVHQQEKQPATTTICSFLSAGRQTFCRLYSAPSSLSFTFLFCDQSLRRLGELLTSSRASSEWIWTQRYQPNSEISEFISCLQWRQSSSLPSTHSCSSARLLTALTNVSTAGSFDSLLTLEVVTWQSNAHTKWTFGSIPGIKRRNLLLKFMDMQ